MSTLLAFRGIRSTFSRNSSTLKFLKAKGKSLFLGTGLALSFSQITSFCADAEPKPDTPQNPKSEDPKNDPKSNSATNSPDPVERFVESVGDMLPQLGFGGVCGIVSAVAFKKLGSQAAYVVGVSFLGLQTLNYLGYISIDWLKIKNQAISLVDADGDGKFTSKDIILFWRHLKSVLLVGIPNASSFGAGFMLGLRYF